MPMDDRDDDLGRFLADALAPHRVPDQAFVDRVSQQIRLDELRRRGRARSAERLGIELMSVLAVGCGLLAIGMNASIADSAGNAPEAALVGIVILFSCWVALVSRSSHRISIS